MIDAITLLRAREAGLPAAESHPDPFLVAFPLKTEWDMLHPKAAEPYPAPLRTSDEGWLPAPLPSAVIGLQRLAQQAGWRCRMQGAEGRYPHSIHGTPGAEPKQSIAVRMCRGDAGAAAVYVSGSTWSWDYLYVWSAQRPWTKLRTLDEFTALVIGPSVTFPKKAEWMKWVRSMGPLVRYPMREGER